MFIECLFRICLGCILGWLRFCLRFIWGWFTVYLGLSGFDLMLI